MSFSAPSPLKILTGGSDKVGISFASIFILTYHIFFWVCGLAHSLSWDYTPDVPQGEAANVRVSWREKPIGGFVWRHSLRFRHGGEGSGDARSAGSHCCPHSQIELGTRHSSGALCEEDSIEGVRSTLRSPVCLSQGSPDQPLPCHGSQATPLTPIRLEAPPRSRRVLTALGAVVTPISAIVAISLLVALVDPLKALFVSFEGGHSWEGPDGKPPLAFVIDTGSSTPLFILAEFPDTVHCPRKAQLIGAMSVPMTLFLLGVSFARMDVKLNPKFGLPISALLSVCVLKLVIMPVIGFFVTRALITGGLINPESKVQIFVAIIVSCAPSALR